MTVVSTGASVVDQELDLLFRKHNDAETGPKPVDADKLIGELKSLVQSSHGDQEAKKEIPDAEEARKSEKPSRREKRKALEDPEEKLGRTLFVGNVPVSCCKDRKLARRLSQLFEGPVESLRFRSVAFETPQARKAAFITHALRKSVSTCNAFVVMKLREDAVKAVNTLNGSVFEEHHLRVDFATAPRLGQKSSKKKTGAASASDAAPAQSMAAPVNTKKSVFLGNLDLELEEEPVWRFFGDLCGRVTNVRLIRDRSTNLGKGIGYVTFADRDSVQLALQLDGRLLKERPVRVQPCCKPGMVEKKKERQAKLIQQRQAQKSGLRASSKGPAASDAKSSALGAPKKITIDHASTKTAPPASTSKFGKAFEKRATNKFPFSSAIENLKTSSGASGKTKRPDVPDASSKTKKTDVSADKTHQKRKASETTAIATTSKTTGSKKPKVSK